MKENSTFLLSELKKHMPKSAYGINLNMYAIALEGWRRGLTLKFFKKNVKNKLRIRYSLSDKNNEHVFNFSLGDKVPRTTTKIVRDKELTKQYLIKANVPVPKGFNFSSNHTIEDMLTKIKGIKYPLVVKPKNGSLGRGVITNICTENELREALKYNREKLGYDDIMVEQCVTGEDTRVVVIDGKVVAAYKRVPANVIGDGKSTIKDLIKLKNKIKSQNPHAFKYPIRINNGVKQFLKNQGYTLDSVLEQGERVYLSNSTLHRFAAETVDVTEKLSSQAIKVAIDAAKAIPEMHFCGIDIMIDYEKNTAYVLEINSRPNLGGNIFPVNGKGRDIPKAIIDFYFPNTKKLCIEKNSHNLYFDFERIEKLLIDGTVKEVVIPSHPQYKVIYKKLIVSGKVQKVGFRKWVKTNAVGLGLSGYVKNLKSGDVLIVIAGEEDYIKLFIELLEHNPPKKSKIANVDINNWNKPVKIGFYIKKNKKKKSNDLSILEKKLLRKIKYMEESKSWKYTKPFRNLIKIMKG